MLGIEPAKAHLKVDEPDEDDLIQDMIDAAVGMLDGYDGYLGRAIVQQSWRLQLPSFPSGRTVRLPLPPLISVDSIVYVDAGGAEQTLPSEAYEVISGPAALIALRTGFAWPSVASLSRAVKINYTAGYGPPEQVPKAIVQAVKVTLAAWYADREGDRDDLPRAAKRLLNAYRVPKV